MSLVTAFVLGCFLCWAASRLPDSINIRPKRNFRRLDSRPSLLGGLAIFISLLIYNILYPSYFINNLLVCSFPLLIVGLIDDQFEISPRWKFLGQISSGLLWFYFIPIENLIFSSYGQIACYTLLTFWILSICSSINFIDGMDGHVATFFITSSYFLTQVHANSEFSLLPLAFIVGGFLVFNFPNAKLYLGETGSSLIGFAIAMYTSTKSEHTQAQHVVGSLFIISYCLIDILYAVIRRKKKGVPVFTSDKEHIHHKFLKVGLNPKQTLAFTFALTSLCGYLGTWILSSTGTQLYISTALSTTAMLSLFFGLLFIERKKNHYLLSTLENNKLDAKQPDFEFDLAKYVNEFHGFNKQKFQKFVDDIKEELKPMDLHISNNKIFGYYSRTNPILKNNERISLIFKNIITRYGVALDDNPLPTGLKFNFEISKLTKDLAG